MQSKTSNNKQNQLTLIGINFYGWLLTILVLLLVLLLIFFVFKISKNAFSLTFFSYSSASNPQNAGIAASAIGSLLISFLSIAIALPIGVGAAIYLEELNVNSLIAKIANRTLTNMTSIPNTIYGLLGLQLWVIAADLKESIIAAGLTLAVMAIPMIVVYTRESLKLVPNTIREAAYALGANPYQVIFFQVLPIAKGGIISGSLLSVARILGEAAPLLLLGAVVYVPFIPVSLLDYFSSMPTQIYNWALRPHEVFLAYAVLGTGVLLLVMLVLNLIGNGLRNSWTRKLQML